MSGPRTGRDDAAVVITACPDGPLLIRGDPAILDDAGNRITPNRRTVALCRCGVSTIKPWCDGSHKLVGFRSGTEAAEPGE